MHTNWGAEALNWTGYVYGGLAHSAHLRYDEAFERSGEGSVRRGLARMGLTPDAIAGRRVLDVGTGLYALGFHRLGALVEHHDISSRTVQALNAYALERGYETLRSVRTDLVEDELPAEHFDLVYLSGIFQHFADPSRALARLARALRVGGYLYVDIYRSGRWRWFVVDVLRKIADRALLTDVLEQFSASCALGATRAFELRQVELLVDDLFVDDANVFRPDDLAADAAALGLERVGSVTSMNLADPGEPVDHGLFFAHVFNTLVFRRTGAVAQASPAPRTRTGRCQLRELEGLGGSYAAVLDLTADFVLAHQAGRFRRRQLVSHLVNLYRMAHPSLPGDPYFVAGAREPDGAAAIRGDDETLRRRHALWCGFLANALGTRSPLETPRFESLGFELVRFLPPAGVPGEALPAPGGAHDGAVRAGV
ncbi:MAG TPA: class I SAM-dependent methyltransferase [Gemmatimonadaceae bacterium]|nr:class I SAM-dependent methyltransferase [Gemmatimonadaceae bacterium]